MSRRSFRDVFCGLGEPIFCREGGERKGEEEG